MLNSFDEYEAEFSSSCMRVQYAYGVNDESSVVLEELNIIVVTDDVYSYALQNIYRYDEFLKNLLSFTIKHEVGHMMHFIMLDGQPVSDVEKIMTYCNKKNREFFEKVLNDGLNLNDLIEEYYNLPYELTANELVGITYKDMLPKLSDDKDITIEINIIEK